MPFSDLQQELQQLGYGNQWDAVQQKLAANQVVTNSSDLQRIKQHNQRFPDKHRQAKARWTKRRLDLVRSRIGKEKCERCFAVMNSDDLIGQNRLLGHCKKCRKDLLG